MSKISVNLFIIHIRHHYTKFMHPSCTNTFEINGYKLRPLCDHCVIPNCDIIYVVMFLVTIIRKTQICRFLLFSFCIGASHLHPYAPTLEINGHEASVYYQYDDLHIICLIINLVTIIKNLSIFACLPVYASKSHPDAPAFEINGHVASVWYQYDILHTVWPNWTL